MKRIVTCSFVLCFLCLTVSHIGVAQGWTAVNHGLSTLLAPSIATNVETLYVSVYGGGVYRSTDFGDNWISVNANIPTLKVNTIELAPYVLAGTDSGVAVLLSNGSWGHLPNVGMTDTIVRFLTLTPDSPSPRLNAATPGGIFRLLSTADSWESANTGLSGAARDARSISAYKSSTINYGIAGTADGVYMTFDNYATWERKSNGLTGSSLLINKVLNLDSPAAIAATDSGLFVTTDVGENWVAVLPSEKFTTGGGGNYPGTGFGLYAFGDRGHVTTNLSTWLDISLTGTTGGHVLDFVTTQNYLFVTTQSGGVFRKALSNITATHEIANNTPRWYALSQNSPNPFNPTTNISYSVMRESYVSLIVYDMLGREVADLVHETKQPGAFSATWNADGVSSGVYVYRMVAREYSATKKMVLMR